MFWILIVSFVALMGVAIAIYLMPSETTAAKRKEKKEKKERRDHRATLVADAALVEQQKDWKSIAERWERNNHALQGDAEKLKMQIKDSYKTLDESKAQVKDLLDKLSLEKSWREKEQVNLDKARHHEKDLKEQIIRTEKDLEGEHSSRLRLEREIQEIKIKYEAVNEEKRAASTKAMSLETTLNQANKELKDLKSENAKLKEKREDVQWVAKTDFDVLKNENAALLNQINKLKSGA